MSAGTAAVDEAGCRHHFVIAEADPAAGTALASPGSCRLCGEKRVFANFIEGDGRTLLIGKVDRRRRQKPRKRGGRA